MIRVISKGPAPEVEKQIVCKNCGATLAYVPRDVKKFTTTDYGGGTDMHEFIDCPECQHKAIIRTL